MFVPFLLRAPWDLWCPSFSLTWAGRQLWIPLPCMKYPPPLLSECDWLTQLPQHSRLPSFPWHTELHRLIKQIHCPPLIFQAPSLKFSHEISLLHLWKDWSPVINRWPTCNSTRPHTHRPHQLWPTLHSCTKETRWWTGSSIVSSSFSSPGCSLRHRLSTLLIPFTSICGFPHLCWIKGQCWSGSAADMLQTPWILSEKILCFLKVLISLAAHCNHLADWGHGRIIPDSIPAQPSSGNQLLPLYLQSSASALRYLLGHRNNKTCTLVSGYLKAAETLN